jgi:hypothetical protein
MAAHARAVETHCASAALHDRLGLPVRAALERERAGVERVRHAGALALRPEWAGEVPALPAADDNGRAV